MEEQAGPNGRQSTQRFFCFRAYVTDHYNTPDIDAVRPSTFQVVPSPFVRVYSRNVQEPVEQDSESLKSQGRLILRASFREFCATNG